MKRALVIAFLVGFISIHGAFPDDSAGVTARRIGFDDMVRESSLIVQGRVLTLESFRNGGAGAPESAAGTETSTPPATRPDVASGQQPGTILPPPVEAGSRPGRMIFTRVTMETTVPIKGSAGKVIEFVVAGGTMDGRVAVVPGMLTFDVGGEYVLFLRNGYRGVADPVVGVNQGFFRVVEDPQSGLQVVLRADSDHVLGIENDGIVTRHNPQRSGSGPQPLGPPAADRAGVRADASPEMQRYWFSTEPLMTAGEFRNAIRSRIRP